MFLFAIILTHVSWISYAVIFLYLLAQTLIFSCILSAFFSFKVWLLFKMCFKKKLMRQTVENMEIYFADVCAFWHILIWMDFKQVTSSVQILHDSKSNVYHHPNNFLFIYSMIQVKIQSYFLYTNYSDAYTIRGFVKMNNTYICLYNILISCVMH